VQQGAKDMHSICVCMSINLPSLQWLNTALNEATEALAKTSSCMNRFVREATDIKFSDNIGLYREEGF
jgi:hypothetical protein